MPSSSFHSVNMLKKIKGERGEGPWENWSLEELGESPGVADLQKCCGLPEQSFAGVNIGFRELKMTAWSFGTSLTR